MAGPEAVAAAAVELERGAHLVLVNGPEWIASHPPGAPLRAPGIPGWVAFVAAGAYFLGTVPTRPEGTPLSLVQFYQRTAGNLERAIEFLEAHDLDAEAMRRQLEGIRNLTEAVRTLRVELDRVAGQQATQTPSPTAILRQELAQLRGTVAVQETWRRGHHGQVHRPLSRAEAQEAGAAIAVASVTASSLSSVVQAIRAVVEHLLPELRRELGKLLRQEAELRRDADRELRADLRERIGDVVDRIGDVVRWLRTEALPDIREVIRAEREARREADKDIVQNTRRNLERLEETDRGLMQALGPLLGPGLAPVLNAGQKVARTEGLFDQLLRSGDLNWAAQLLVAGPFVVLVTRILGRVAGQLPEVLGGLEDAAARAIGVVD